MSSVPSTCPYCNSPAVIPPGTVSGQRIACGRCGESFPYRGPAMTGEEMFTAAPPPLPGPSVPPTPPRRLANHQVALLVIGLMGLMAVIGLLFAVNTEAVRRAHDVRLPKSKAVDVPVFARVALGLYAAGLIAALVWGWNRREQTASAGEPRPWSRLATVPGLALLAMIAIVLALLALRGRPARQGSDVAGPPPVPRIPPKDLPALGYLPKDVDAIIGLHIAEAQDDPTGEHLLARLQLGDAGVSRLETWTGLKLAELEHVAVGLKLQGVLIPRLTVVARTRQPYDADKVRVALKAHRSPEPGITRPIYQFKPQTGSQLDALPACLWCADDRTLVIHTSKDPKEWDGVPLQPRTGLDHLQKPLAEFLTGRMGLSAQVWVVGHVDDWDKVLLSVMLAGQLGKEWETIKEVRTLGASLLCDSGVTLSAAFECAGEDAAEKWHKYLMPDDQAPRQGLKVLGQRPDTEPMWREFGKTLKVVQDGRWVEVQAKASAEAVRPAETARGK